MTLTREQGARLTLAAGLLLALVGAGLTYRAAVRAPQVAARPPEERVESPTGAGRDRGPASDAPASDQRIEVTAAAQRSAGIRVETVSRQPLPQTLVVTGEIETTEDRAVQVTSRVSGRVRTLVAGVGDTVSTNQPLLTVDSPEVAQAQATLRQATARLQLVRTNLQRQKELAGLGEFTQGRVEAARGAVSAAEGDLDEGKNARRQAESQVAQAESARAAADTDVATARAGAIEGEAGVSQAQANISQGQAAAELARTKLARAERLLQAEVISRASWEEARAARDSAAADLVALQATLRQQQARLEALQSAVRAAQAREKQAAGAVGAAQSAVGQIEARIEAIGRRLQLARQALAREEQIFRGRYLSSKEVVDAEALVRQATVEREAALDALRLLGSSPGAGSVVTIRAPIGGRVQTRPITLGETVDSKTPLLGIASLDVVWAQLAIQQADLPRVAVGQAVTVRADATPGVVYAGAITQIGDVVDANTRTVRARCVIRNAVGKLKPGMFVHGEIGTRGRVLTLAIPKDAIQREGERIVVYIRTGPETFAERLIQAGRSHAGWVEVLEGLREGDRIAVSGTFRIKSVANGGALEGDE